MSNTSTGRQVGRWRLLNSIDHALRDTYADPHHSGGRAGDPVARVVDCPYCARPVRPSPRGGVRLHGDPLARALHEHLFERCHAVEVTRR